MKRICNIITSLICLLGFCSCVGVVGDNPFEGHLCDVSIALDIPSDYSGVVSGIALKAENVDNGYEYSTFSDAQGVCSMRLPLGIYRFTVSYKSGPDILNGALERLRVVDSSLSSTMKLFHTSQGAIVIKEVYCGGCKVYKDGEFFKDYQSDKYVIIHNNDTKTVYLDSLCIGSLAPYNSQSQSDPLSGVKTADGRLYRDVYAPVIAAILQIGGDGHTFPLEPGQDAVIVLCGAIDHRVLTDESVDLNNENYFVCYNTTYFPNETYHPAPGDKIREDHYLNVVRKLGQGNAFTISNSSPAVVIYRPDKGSLEDYLERVAGEGEDDSIIQLPGSKVDKILNLPLSWVYDAVEIFSGKSTNNLKRANTGLDAGYVTLSDTNLGHSLIRKVDEGATAENGFEVLVDTNNSSNDFYESEKQSLHE